GTNAITRIGLLVPTVESLLYWKGRLHAYAITHDEKCTTYAGRQALHFTDPDGLRLVFVVANGEKESFWQGWDEADIPIEHQILGMGPVELTVRRLEKLRKTLTGLLGYVEKEQVN